MQLGAQSQEDLSRWPLGLLAVSVMIPLVGVLNIASASRATMQGLWMKQLIWLAAGLLCAVVIARVRTQTLELVAYPIFVVTCGLLVLVLAIGTPHKGAQRWLDIGPVGGQPSELAKIAIILVVARYFADYEAPQGLTLSELLRPFNVTRPLGVIAFAIYRHFHKQHALAVAIKKGAAELPTVPPLWMTGAIIGVGVVWLLLSAFDLFRGGMQGRKIIAPVDIVLLPFVLILIEPDLGTASIVLAIAGTMILFCGMRLRDLVVSFVVSISIAVFAWAFLLHDYQRKRVETFLDPEADIQGAGYHAAQSIIAVGSGQVTGKGYGQGTQTQLSFLPENHTDFVFSVLGEEWGLVGGFMLIVLFYALLALMMRGARRATDRFSALLAVGASAMIFWHAFINMGMVIGVLPVVGVTLPLMSYGGSSMITKMIAVGFALHAQMPRKVS